MSISKDLQSKLDYYEQLYFSLDEPVPFKEGLKIYPVLVKDYYKFYSCFPCITIDKNVKEVENDDGIIVKVSNKDGMRKSYMRFLIDEMQDKKRGALLTNQLMGLFELVFHIPLSIYCPNCGATKEYNDAFVGLEEYTEQVVKDTQVVYDKFVSEQRNKGINIENTSMPDVLKERIITNARVKFMHDYGYKCPYCHGEMRDIFSFKQDGKKKILVVKNVEFTADDFDEFKAIVPRQNILDYDGDKYVDPDLKEELELKAKLKNKDYTSPTLEKQMIAVSSVTGFTLDYIKNHMNMRKLTYYLKMIDNRDNYRAQIQGAMSGMVKFKEDPKHWIFSENKKNIKDELTEYSEFEKKFQHVV